MGLPAQGEACFCLGSSPPSPGLIGMEVTLSLTLIPKNTFENPCYQKDSCQISKNKFLFVSTGPLGGAAGGRRGLGSSRLSISGAHQGLKHSGGCSRVGAPHPRPVVTIDEECAA